MRLCTWILLAFVLGAASLFGDVAISCPPPPTGLVGWWPADATPEDVVGGNDGTNDGATFVPGMVNEAFHFDGSTSAVIIGNPAALQLQTFSIVAWVTRADVNVAGNGTFPSADTGMLFAYGAEGYGFGLQANGKLFLSKVEENFVQTTGATVADVSPHLVAVTVDSVSGDIIFYVDGVASPTVTLGSVFLFTSNAAIGVAGDLQPPGAAGNFFGDIDEMQVYDKVLTGAQVLSIFDAASNGTCRIFPQPLSVDINSVAGTVSNTNGILEPGETVQIVTAWQNKFPGSETLTGSASIFTGPTGPTYTIAHGTATYGTVASDHTADCNSASGECFLVSVSGDRPAAHWDATLQETLTGASTTFRQNSLLHVGESFLDVLTTDQFYAFIENLFHNGVTGGCGAGNYCPTNPVTRAQMAVFLLKGEHGGTYTPPACSATMFGDVPCPGGTFVDWVNQLATEGITGGCGGGNYCPDNPVTRAQMAVFLLKAEHGSTYTPPACTGVFGDVPCPSQFADWIEQLAAEQITGGCGGGNYCPADSVTRGQMAAFLTKTFGLILYGP